MSRTFALDLLERCGKTFAQTFIAQLLVSGTDLVHAITDASTLQKAAVAGLAAVLSIVTSLLSSGVGSNGTASVVEAIHAADGNAVHGVNQPGDELG